MPKRTSDFRENLLADLADPAEAARYLNAALEDSDQMALVALRDVAEARQMSRVAESAGVAREAIYRMLRRTGNPTYTSLMGILSALGLRIAFEPIDLLGDSTKTPIESMAMASGSVSGSASFIDSIQGNPPNGETQGTLGTVPRQPSVVAQGISYGREFGSMLSCAASIN
jgi:probable addiction module antidote protein